MKDVLQRIMYPLHSSSFKRHPWLYPWLFEEDLRLSELTETSLLEWPHLWKRSPRTQETSSFVLSRLQSCWFHSQRDGKSYANPSSAKNPPPKQPNNPPPKLCDTVYPQFNTSGKAGDNCILLYLFTKWQVVGSQWYMRFPKEWGKNKIHTFWITAKRRCGGKETSDYCP